jgi:hypothetical protein
VYCPVDGFAVDGTVVVPSGRVIVYTLVPAFVNAPAASVTVIPRVTVSPKS